MCGIFALFSKSSRSSFSPDKTFDRGKHRGPEESVITYTDDVCLGFHRLAINGYGMTTSSQPISIENCILICNGEIYNWKEINENLGITSSTGSDCEVIIHLYKKFGIKGALQYIEGVYAFVLYDKQTKECHIARDLFGVRPLFMCSCEYMAIACASELKMLVHVDPKNTTYIRQFDPGSYCTIIDERITYTERFALNCSVCTDMSRVDACRRVEKALTNAVRKRAFTTDRPIAALLSGGLDSSLVAAILSNVIKPYRLQTWSIGMHGSPDILHAKNVAKYIGSNHTSIELTPDDFLSVIQDVIYAIESYDVTTVRASVGNWLIAKHIREKSDAKVIFNGDGADECCGGYLYMGFAPDALSFDFECKRLLNDIHFFDVLRSDRSISAHGLEARTPFLDREFVETYMSIPYEYRRHTRDKKDEKQLLRDAFKNSQILPDSTLFRQKEAFSDGVSSEEDSWFQIIQRHIKKLYPWMTEAQYYKQVFSNHFPNCSSTIPYRWMPRFVTAIDPSARTLSTS